MAHSPDKQGMALMLIKRMKDKKDKGTQGEDYSGSSEDEDEEVDPNDEKQALGEDILSAVKEEDVEALVDALCALITLESGE